MNKIDKDYFKKYLINDFEKHLIDMEKIKKEAISRVMSNDIETAYNTNPIIRAFVRTIIEMRKEGFSYECIQKLVEFAEKIFCVYGSRLWKNIKWYKN